MVKFPKLIAVVTIDTYSRTQNQKLITYLLYEFVKHTLFDSQPVSGLQHEIMILLKY